MYAFAHIRSRKSENHFCSRNSKKLKNNFLERIRAKKQNVHFRTHTLEKIGKSLSLEEFKK